MTAMAFDNTSARALEHTANTDTGIEYAAALKDTELNWRTPPTSLVYLRSMKAAVCYPTLILCGEATNEED